MSAALRATSACSQSAWAADIVVSAKVFFGTGSAVLNARGLSRKHVVEGLRVCCVCSLLVLICALRAHVRLHLQGELDRMQLVRCLGTGDELRV